jgi:N-carbamoylputrescine amidase
MLTKDAARWAGIQGGPVKISVCELHPEMQPGSDDWKEFASRLNREKPDLLLLNEMPFGPWIAAGERFDASTIAQSQRMHEEGVAHLQELGVPIVLGSRALDCAGHNVNEAFVWTRQNGARGVHTKQYFPDEAGFYEARWFESGERHFRTCDEGAVRIGFLICSEVMFNEHARHYGKRSAHLIEAPRATPGGSLARWMVALRMAAIVSGCYVASSNRSGADSRGQRFGGCGCVVDPNGDIVAQTSPTTPVVSYELDLDFAARSQREYPCCVPELPMIH